jgi:hypothetical protein
MDLSEFTLWDVAENCLDLLEQCRSAARDEKVRVSFENRFADFTLWCDGVGAMARTRASLDRRFGLQPDDLTMVKGILALFRRFLDNCIQLIANGQSIDEALCNVDSALENLGLLAMAIRQTGKRSRLEKADSKYRPDEHSGLRDHLECMLRLRRGPAGHTAGCLDCRQHRLVEGNLRRRNRFLQAQKHSQDLKSGKSARATAAPRQFQAASTSKTTEDVQTSQSQTLDLSRTTPSEVLAQNELPAPTESGNSASVPEGNVKFTFKETGRRSLGSDLPRTVITRITASTSYPYIKVPDGQKYFQCPCCYQTLSKDYSVDSLWR